MVEIPWDATSAYGDVTKGQIEVELIDMGMIECKHGWDLHAMGNVRQGSGGTEWAAVYNDEYLSQIYCYVKQKSHILTMENQALGLWCIPCIVNDVQEECRISMGLPLN